MAIETTEPLKGLNTKEGQERQDEIFGFSKSTQEYKLRQALKPATPDIEYVGVTGIGDSKYDKYISSLTQLQDLEDTRARLQPWYDQVGAGIVKGVLLAGTTFLDGTAGLLYGIGTAITEDRLSGLWDNEFSRALNEVNKAADESFLKNYYTKEQSESPWYSAENLFSANFIGDKLIKNFGFTIGAMYSGGVASSLLSATKLPKAIALLTKSTRAAKHITSGLGASISALNESRIEALNNSDEWYKLELVKLQDKYKKRLEDIETYKDLNIYNDLKLEADLAYQETSQQLKVDRAKMGNADMLINMPILLASNLWEFGKFYEIGRASCRERV